jgi:SAM-dependent methyltransferase
VLDVGCGSRPYEPLFAGVEASYVGLDAEPGPGVDVVARAEGLPFEDAEFDCVLCTQVLQYVPDPGLALGEIHRVLGPRGVALVSTHGVAPAYHAGDYWRWTRAGLRALFSAAGEWSAIEVVPQGGVASAVAYLWCRQVEAAAARVRLRPLAAGPVLVANALAWNLDRARSRSGMRWPDLSPNYLVVAERG